MKALTVVGTLAAALALTACSPSNNEGRDAAGTQGSEQRAGDSSNATVESSRDASGSSGSDTAAGTMVNRPADAAPSVPGQQDAVVTGTPQAGAAAERAGQATENTTEKAGNAIQNAGERAMDATARGADAATDAVADAAITASVNAELARDEQLSALRINVDTENSRVTLSGTAPSQEAAQRATQLAQKVRGVKEVENELKVEAR
ncbi:BON domain-containing protein [Caldimonas tepidiphila]|uniref:BON domain-containing protein n=1 Tax=Caldimonas tepidiphila TaxID=2315841 RepID=UPI001F0C3651|nr:BON domain-containing protein [Caldimonas tepidiphila]